MNDLTITLTQNPTHAPGQTHHIDFDVVVGTTTYAAICTAKDTAGGRPDPDPCVSTAWREREVEWDGLLINDQGKKLKLFKAVRQNIERELDRQLSRLS